MRAAVLLGVAALLASAAGFAQRPALRDASAIRIANYGAPSLLVQDREEVRALLDELNALRRKPWRREDTPLQCYSTVVVMQGKKRAAEFRVRPGQVVERPLDKGQSAYTAIIEPSDIPRLAQILARIAPAICK
jgi:hypothetical protein